MPLFNFLFKSKGQAFITFRLLIAAILGLAILAIVINTIIYFSKLEQDISYKHLISAIKQAANALNPSELELRNVIVREKITINEGQIFTSRQFAKILNIDEQCVKIDGDYDDRRYSIENNRKITFLKKARVNIYFACYVSFYEECEYECLISFGKAID